jgi:hypothetical protein
MHNISDWVHPTEGTLVATYHIIHPVSLTTKCGFEPTNCFGRLTASARATQLVVPSVLFCQYARPPAA